MLFNLQLSTASSKCYLITCTQYCLNYFLTTTSYHIQNSSLTTTDTHTHTHTQTHSQHAAHFLENKLTPLVAATRSDTPSPSTVYCSLKCRADRTTADGSGVTVSDVQLITGALVLSNKFAAVCCFSHSHCQHSGCISEFGLPEEHHSQWHKYPTRWIHWHLMNIGNDACFCATAINLRTDTCINQQST